MGPLKVSICDGPSRLPSLRRAILDAVAVLTNTSVPTDRNGEPTERWWAEVAARIVGNAVTMRGAGFDVETRIGPAVEPDTCAHCKRSDPPSPSVLFVRATRKDVPREQLLYSLTFSNGCLMISPLSEAANADAECERGNT